MQALAHPLGQASSRPWGVPVPGEAPFLGSGQRCLRYPEVAGQPGQEPGGPSHPACLRELIEPARASRAAGGSWLVYSSAQQAPWAGPEARRAWGRPHALASPGQLQPAWSRPWPGSSRLSHGRRAGRGERALRVPEKDLQLLRALTPPGLRVMPPGLLELEKSWRNTSTQWAPPGSAGWGRRECPSEWTGVPLSEQQGGGRMGVESQGPAVPSQPTGPWSQHPCGQPRPRRVSKQALLPRLDPRAGEAQVLPGLCALQPSTVCS